MQVPVRDRLDGIFLFETRSPKRRCELKIRFFPWFWRDQALGILEFVSRLWGVRVSDLI